MKFKRTRYTKEQFIQAVKDSISVKSVLEELGLSPTGANYKNFYDNIKYLELDISHFNGKGHLKGKHHNWNKKIPIEEILVENSSYTCTTSLKSRLKKENLLEQKCAICGISEWKNEILSLVLDHINGINNDHRIENLRLLCPNCNSQTNTFAGRNIGRYSAYINREAGVKNPTKAQKEYFCIDCGVEIPVLHKRCNDCKKVVTKAKQRNRLTENCIDCGKSISGHSTRCKSCVAKLRPKKFHVPKEELEKLIWAYPMTKLGEIFGVSDNAVRKRCKSLGITKFPPQGYFLKK